MAELEADREALETLAPRVRRTYCETCDHVHAESRKRTPSSWLCTKFPRMEGFGFVAPKVWAEGEPYMKCVGINGGACPLYKQVRNGQQDNGL